MPSASVWPSDGRAAALALFPLLRREPAANELQSARILLRPPHASDHGQWRALRKASRAFLQPWEPKWPDDEFTAAAWRERMRRYQREASLGSGQAWFLFLVLTGYRNGTQVLGYVVYAEAFGQTGEGASFRQGYAAAGSIVLFLLVLVIGMAANFVVSRRERKYMG